jgi:hypothetical protein
MRLTAARVDRVAVTWQQKCQLTCQWRWSGDQWPLPADRYKAVFSPGEINPSFSAQHKS